MADAFGDEADETVTINEYIEDVEAAELEADMVLGGDEGKECTYERGYMKRQAIFSCLTCVPSGNAGVCTACSLTCHDGHEIVELWTKRNFRCDCGNSKFGQFSCKLFANKDPENLQNNYNENFQGSYCICHRPYPDPEAIEQVEMIQCCICEDWFHENHIGLEPTEEIPRDEEGEPLYDDFICPDCSPKVSFLKLYPRSIWTSRHNNGTISNPEGNISENAADCKPSEKTEKESCFAAEISTVGDAVPVIVSNGNDDRNLLLNGDAACSKNAGPIRCLLEVNLSQMQVTFEKKKPLFPSKKWRENICRCHTCCELYTKSGVGYLIDEEDSMEEYEKMAKQKREEKLQRQEGAELNFINKLDHVQKIEILTGIADMKNELSTFMESFDSSKPITAADVRGIFENLAKKRQRLQ